MNKRIVRISHAPNRPLAILRKSLAFAVVVLFLCWCIPAGLRAADGDLDLTFGTAGKVTTSFGGVDRAFGMAIQRDGKLVVTGVANQNSGSTFALARYNNDGSLDPTFGAGGKVATTFNGLGDEAHAVVIQNDGKIVVAGTATIDSVDRFRDFALARYNTDGSLDSSFGSGGKVTTDFLEWFDVAYAIALQSDGRIVVAGAAQGDAIFFALARYNADGSLDASFGTGGKVTTDFQGRLNQALAYSVLVQRNGKIVAAGRVDDTWSNFGLARYNVDGSLDSTFGSAGKVKTNFSGMNDEGKGLAIQSDGKLLLAGSANFTSTTPDFALARYNADGTLDSSFGVSGKVITDFNAVFEGANAIALQADRKIVIAGTAGLGFGLARYNPDGSLDPSFGVQGKDITFFDRGCGGADAFAVAIQNDGKVIAAGDAFDCGTGFNFALARYNGTPPFDLCLQDDTSGDTLRINSITGEYQFTRCSTGFMVGGMGTLIKTGSILTLQHYAVDRRVFARIDTSQNRGSASIQLSSLGVTLQITDRNTSNNTCACN
jgi:uncharacterized delta-60 repeat protein